jgi:hypothetical protein
LQGRQDLARFVEALVVAPGLRKQMSEHQVTDRMAGVESRRAAEARLGRRPVPVKPPVHMSHRELRLGEVRIGTQRARRGFARAATRREAARHR